MEDYLICEICDTFEARYIPETPARADEPAGGGFWECLICGGKITEESAWERKQAAAEARADDRRGH